MNTQQQFYANAYREAARKEKFKCHVRATKAAKKVLKKGDRLTVTKCPGTKRWIIFDHWVGDEIVSKSGQYEYCAMAISKVNGQPVNFTAKKVML